MVSSGWFVELFVLGFLAALSTCSTACLPVFLTAIIGRWPAWPTALGAASLLLMTRLVVFSALGAAAAGLGHTLMVFFGQQQRFLLAAAATVIFGIGLFFVLAPQRWQPGGICLRRSSSTTWWDLVALGIVMAGIPCPPHLAVLAFIGVQGLAVLPGALAAAGFALGGTVPLLVLAVLAGSLSPTLGRWLKGLWVRRIAGAVMIFLALRVVWSAWGTIFVW